MKTIEINNNQYQIGTLDAFKQFHVFRRLAPLLAALVQQDGKGLELDDLLLQASTKIAEVLAQMPDEEVNYVIKTCLSVCSRKQKVGQQETWVPVAPNGVVMFSDLKLQELLGLTINVIRENMGDFFPIAPQTSEATK